MNFDRADSLWLAAYTQFLSAGCDLLLAHDFEPSFRTVGPSLFAGVKSMIPIRDAAGREWMPVVVDFVAAIHQIRWECQNFKENFKGTFT